jgi:hypothetical protein
VVNFDTTAQLPICFLQSGEVTSWHLIWVYGILYAYTASNKLHICLGQMCWMEIATQIQSPH